MPRLLVAHAEVGHRGPALDALRVLDPPHHVVRRVRELSAEVGPRGDAVQGWADHAAGALNPRDHMTGVAAVFGNQGGSLIRIASGQARGLLPGTRAPREAP